MRYRVTFAGSYDVEADSAEEAELNVLPLVEANPSELIPVAYPVELDEAPHIEIGEVLWWGVPLPYDVGPFADDA